MAPETLPKNRNRERNIVCFCVPNLAKSCGMQDFEEQTDVSSVFFKVFRVDHRFFSACHLSAALGDPGRCDEFFKELKFRFFSMAKSVNISQNCQKFQTSCWQVFVQTFITIKTTDSSFQSRKTNERFRVGTFEHEIFDGDHNFFLNSVCI